MLYKFGLTFLFRSIKSVFCSEQYLIIRLFPEQYYHYTGFISEKIDTSSISRYRIRHGRGLGGDIPQAVPEQ